MQQKKSKKALAIVMAILLLLSTVPLTMFVSAAQEEVYQIDLPRGDDSNKSGWGHGKMYFLNGWQNTHEAEKVTAKAMGSYEGKTVYCIEPGVSLHTGDTLTQKGEAYWDNYPSNLNDILTPYQIKQQIGRILQYGWLGNNSLSWVSTNATDVNEMANMLATQHLIWEVIVGERDVDFNKINAASKGKNNIMECIASNHPFRAKILEHYNRIAGSVVNHTKLPSFMSRSASTSSTHTLSWDGSKYSVTLTDTNAVLANYNFSATGATCTVSGNTLTISSTTAPASDITITANKKTSKRKGVVTWSDEVMSNKDNGQYQDVISYTAEVDDPVQGYVKVKVNNGSMSILKTTKNNDGNVVGFKFEVRNSSNTLIGTYTTTATGKIDVPNLPAGSYTVKEVDLSNEFVTPTPNPKTVTVVAGQNATVSFDNVKKLGVITIVKTATDTGANLRGAVFEVHNASGTLVDTVTTGADGKAATKALPLGTYRITEKTAPNGYRLNTNTFTATISGSQGATAIVYAPEVGVTNQPQLGKINVKKSNSNAAMGDYDLAGAMFEIYSGSTLVDTVTTNSKGEAQSKALPLGSYTVKEKSAPYGYVLNTGSFTATLAYAGQNEEFAYTTVNVPQRPQTGVIRVHKTNAKPSMGDYALTGAVFEVHNVKGTLVDTITTDVKGEAATKELPLGAYKVTEKTAPYGFVRNTETFSTSLVYAGQDVTVTYADVTVPEMPQVGKITVTKLDKETGSTPQGDATLAGAVFEVYASDKTTLVDTLYCGTDVKATTKELPLGTYYVNEKTPPVGYNLNDSFHEVKILYAGQDVEVVLVDSDVKNVVIKGQIALVKHTDQPDDNVSPENPQVEQPLEGAIFEVYLKSAGSYDNAKATERDKITTDENGYAKTKLLPYGVYTVKETYAPGDVKLVTPYDVFISAEGRVYRYILNDPQFTSLVKIVKVDAETGKTIPAAGTAFKVKDLATGKWVSQSFNYPTPTTIDVFETAPDGTLVMPEALKSGDYELHEVQAPYGYVLSKEPVQFTIHSSTATADVLEVKMQNMPVKGIITVEKQGEMLTGVQEVKTKHGTQYVPVFENRYLEGAKFNVIAAEDIITPDGTVRYEEGTIVDTITTGADGKAGSKELYLGNYEVVEVEAPYGFVLDKTPHAVSLVYEGQEVPVVSSQIGVDNIRQQVEITLQKLMEKPVNAPADDFNAFTDVLFGLYANEDIKAVDGTVVIPKDGLVALLPVDTTGKAAFTGNLPFVDYYVKEIATNPYYQLNTNQYPVTVDYAGQGVAVAKFQATQDGSAIPNELKLGQLVIEKQGEILVGATQTEVDGKLIFQPVYENRPLAGAVFDIIAAEDIYDVYGKLLYKKGDVVDTVTTGADGKATSRPIHLGKYVVVEVVAPQGFVLDETQHAVTLGFDSEVTEVITKQITIYNQRQKAEINMKKLVEMPENTHNGFNPYKDILFGLYAKGDVLAADGSVIVPQDRLLEIITIDADGNAVIKTDLPYGSYYVKELQTAAGYVLDDAIYSIEFNPNQESTAIISIAVNEGNPILNKLQRGNLRIVKTFEGKDAPVEGVPFLVTGKTAVGVDIEITVYTNANGEILLENLPVGEYTITELADKTNDGYKLADAQIVTITAGETTEVMIHNELIFGSIRVLKVDADSGEVLSGALFGLYQDGKLIKETKSGKDGWAVFEELPYGAYEVKEIAAPAGYKLADTMFTAVINGEQKDFAFKLANEKEPDMPQPTEPEVPQDVPNTGDDSNPRLWIGLLGVSVTCLAVVLLVGCKKKKATDSE